VVYSLPSFRGAALAERLWFFGLWFVLCFYYLEYCYLRNLGCNSELKALNSSSSI
jgi:hypothetical protein